MKGKLNHAHTLPLKSLACLHASAEDIVLKAGHLKEEPSKVQGPLSGLLIAVLLHQGQLPGTGFGSQLFDGGAFSAKGSLEWRLAFAGEGEGVADLRTTPGVGLIEDGATVADFCTLPGNAPASGDLPGIWTSSAGVIALGT